jgi:hypothetical protein
MSDPLILKGSTVLHVMIAVPDGRILLQRDLPVAREIVRKWVSSVSITVHDGNASDGDCFLRAEQRVKALFCPKSISGGADWSLSKADECELKSCGLTGRCLSKTMKTFLMTLGGSVKLTSSGMVESKCLSFNELLSEARVDLDSNPNDRRHSLISCVAVNRLAGGGSSAL